MSKDPGSHWKLGMFVVIGLVLFAGTIYFVGKQQNLFGSTFHLTAKFVSAGGLKEGNNVRFSGINIGTVNTITLTDSLVEVDLVLRKNVQEFIKTDATATIGSDGLMGDKVLTINPGTRDSKAVKDGDLIGTKKVIDMDDIMASIKTNADNAAIITAQLAEFTYKMNNGTGLLSKVISDPALTNSLMTTLSNLQNSSNEFSKFTVMMNNGKGALATLVSDEAFSDGIRNTLYNLEKTSNEFLAFGNKVNTSKGSVSRLITDEKMGKSLDSTLLNIQSATQKLDDNMEALQSNILLRGFFKKKEKAEAKKAADNKKAAEVKLLKDNRIADQLRGILRSVRTADSLRSSY